MPATVAENIYYILDRKTEKKMRAIQINLHLNTNTLATDFNFDCIGNYGFFSNPERNIEFIIPQRSMPRIDGEFW